MRTLFLQLALIVILFAFPSYLHAQTTQTIIADSIQLTNGVGNAELILENATRNVKGFLYNRGNGRTEFRRAMIKLNDSLYVFGDDTLNINHGGISPSSNVFVRNDTVNTQSGGFRLDGIGYTGRLYAGTTVITNVNDRLRVAGDAYIDGLRIGYGAPQPGFNFAQNGRFKMGGHNFVSEINATGTGSLNIKGRAIIDSTIRLGLYNSTPWNAGSVGQMYYNLADNNFYGYKTSWKKFLMEGDTTGIGGNFIQNTPSSAQTANAWINGAFTFEGSGTTPSKFSITSGNNTSAVFSSQWRIQNSTGYQFGGNNIAPTSGNFSYLRLISSSSSSNDFNPTTGNASLRGISVDFGINQTGTANGNIYGYYYNPNIISINTTTATNYGLWVRAARAANNYALYADSGQVFIREKVIIGDFPGNNYRGSVTINPDGSTAGALIDMKASSLFNSRYINADLKAYTVSPIDGLFSKVVGNSPYMRGTINYLDITNTNNLASYGTIGYHAKITSTAADNATGNIQAVGFKSEVSSKETSASQFDAAFWAKAVNYGGGAAYALYADSGQVFIRETAEINTWQYHNKGGLVINKTQTGLITKNGANNIVIGNGAGNKTAGDINLQAASRMVIIGDNAATSDNNGSSPTDGVYIGYKAGGVVGTGNPNNDVMIGSYAGSGSTTIVPRSSSKNTAIGGMTGIARPNSFNTIIGYGAKGYNGVLDLATNTNAVSYLTVIGAEAEGNLSNHVFLGRKGKDDVQIGRILKLYDTTFAPTGVNGGMYYNTNTHQFQGYRNGAWKSFLTEGDIPNNAWLLGGNANTSPATYFIGTTDVQPLVFKTNNTEALRLSTSGNLHIGTSHDAVGYSNRLDFGSNGNSDPVWLSRYNYAGDQTELRLNVGDDGGDRFTIGNHHHTDSEWRPAFSVTSGGLVSIGTMTVPSGYKLAVGGNIISEKITLKLQESWPDYVFSANYQLPSLRQVEQFIKQYRHLPGIPSAEEIKKDGLNVGENQAQLLKKIEELTLYSIEQNKKIEQLEQENKKMQDLEKRLAALESLLKGTK